MKSNNKLLLMLGVFLFAIFLIYLSSSFYQVLVLSVLLSYMVYPLKEKILKKSKNQNFASLISLLIGFLIFVLVVFLLLFSLYNGITWAKTFFSSNENINLLLTSFDLFQNLNIEELLSTAGITQLFNILQIVVLITPNLIINVIIFLIFSFYFIKYGESILMMIRGLIPPGELRLFDKFMDKLNLIMKSIFQGQLITALIQSSILFISLLLLQIPYAFELSFFTFIMCFLNITSLIVPVGLSLYYLYYGITTGNFILFIISIIILVIVFTIDDFIKPLIGKKIANLNPILFLLGIIGGVSTLGFTGFITGPIITSSFQALFEINYGKD